MSIETIFLCFCKDSEDNDGLSKPYSMSRNLMEFVENSRYVTKPKQTKQNVIFTISKSTETVKAD